MVQENTGVKIEVTADDVEAVMQSNPLMSLQVQNRSLMRKLGETQGEIAWLRQELEQAKSGNGKKKG